MPYLAEQLAEYVVGADFATLPAEVVRHAKFCILDSVGVAVAGALTPASRAVRDVARRLGGPQEATVWRYGDRVAGANAAFANAMFAHALDYNDDIAGVQEGGIAAPLALSLGEAVGADGRDVIAAVVAAYDVVTRVATAANSQEIYGRGFQPTAVCGVFSAAAGAARLLGLNAPELANAFGIAGSYAGGTNEFLKEGTNTKPLHAAKSAHLGAIAASLAKAGMTGPRSIFEGDFGLFQAYGRDSRPHLLLEDLGTRYDILQTSVKTYPCGDGNAAPLQAALAIVRENGLRPPEIESLHFRIKSLLIPFAFSFMGDSSRRYRPENELDARMSLPYCVAVGLLNDGRLGLEDFEPGRFADPGVHALADRITAEGDRDLDRIPFLPMSMPAIATLKTTDGRVFTKRVDYQKGDPRNPLTPEEFQSKFEACVADVLGPDKTAQAATAILGLDELSGLDGLARTLSA